MRPEDWLRDRGIEVTHGGVQPRRGDVAGQATAALPIVRREQIPIEQIATQRMPALTGAETAASQLEASVADIAERPTSTLDDDVPNLPTATLAGDMSEPATERLPAQPQDISTTPTRKLGR